MNDLNILALDTSSSVLCVSAIGRDGTTSALDLDGGLRHSENLVSVAEICLALSHIQHGDIDHVACGIGPGSFTGLRIGLAAAKGFALGLDIQVSTFSSLDLIARNVSDTKHRIIVALNARRNKIYAAVYEYRSGALKKVVQDCLVTFDQLLSLTSKKESIFVGDALIEYGDQIRKKLKHKAILTHESSWRPHASRLAEWLKAGSVRSMKRTELRRLKPEYLRLSEAEERKLGVYS